jgi:hypothetical protein
MKHWSALTNFASIGPGTDMLIFEEMVAGAPPSRMRAGDAIGLKLGGASDRLLRRTVEQADRASVIIALQDSGRWMMTPRRPDEAQVGVIWKGATPTQEWVIRSAA